MGKQPVVLISHAGWHRPVHYRPLIKDLREKGFIVLAPPLPSAAHDDSLIGKSTSHDVARIHEVLVPYLDAGHKAIIFAHSSGGIAGTVAIKDQTVAERAARGLEGGIVSIIWLAAVVPWESGVSLLDAAGGEWRGVEWYEVGEETLPLKHPISEDYSYSDLPEKVKQEAANLRCSQSIRPFVDVVPYCCKDVPIDKTFIMCKQDLASAWPVQQFYAQQIGGKTIELDCGHFPFLREDKRPELVDIIVKNAEEHAGKEQ